MTRYDRRTNVEDIESKFPWIKDADIDGAWINIGAGGELVWERGIWKEGVWEDGTWAIGTWREGTWRDGTWKYGDWEKGTWEKGIWKEGVWEDGTWEDGTWEDGTWELGTWERGVWEGGTWKKGDFHVNFNGNVILLKKPIIGDVDKMIKELGSRLTKENFEKSISKYAKLKKTFEV